MSNNSNNEEIVFHATDRPTSYITTGALGAVFLKIITDKRSDNKNIKNIQYLEALILIIAFLQYLIVFSIKSERRAQRWRYLDWALTTPLLLTTYYLFAREKGYESEDIWIPIIFNEIMIIAGYFAEFYEASPLNSYLSETENKYFWFILSFGALAVVLYYVFKWTESLTNNGVDVKALPYFFYIGWILYGVNFLTTNTNIRQTVYDSLDLFAKPVYTLYLTQIIEESNV